MLIAITGIAQNYHITDFLPDSLKTWQIYGTLNTNIGNNTSDNNYDLEKKDTEYSNLDARLNPGVTFQYKTITRRREWSFLSNFSPEFIKENSITESTMDRDTVWRTNSSDYSDTRQEYNFSNQFDLTEYVFKKLGVTIESDIQMTHTFSKTETDITDKYGGISHGSFDIFEYNHDNYENNNISIELCPGISYGRIYDGNYAAKAEEILIELRRMNCLKRELTPAEFHALAQRILIHTEKYHYDSRIQRIEALQDIIDYLNSIGAITANDTPAILTINDIYLYSPFDTYPRRFGSSIYLKTSFSFDYSETYEESGSKVKTWEFPHSDTNDNDVFIDYTSSNRYSKIKKLKSLGYSVGINYFKIKSWHFWYDATLDFTYQFNIYEDHIKRYEEKIYHSIPDSVTLYEDKTKTDAKNHDDILSASMNLYYQFNSRSIFKIPIKISYRFFHGIPFNNPRINVRRGRSGSTRIIYEYPSDSILRYHLTTISFQPQLIYRITPKWSINPSLVITVSKRRDVQEKFSDCITDFELSFSTTYYW